MHDDPNKPPAKCPICGSRVLEAFNRQSLNRDADFTATVLSYRCENGHVIIPFVRPSTHS